MADFRPAGWDPGATAGHPSLPTPVTLRRERSTVLAVIGGLLVTAAGAVMLLSIVRLATTDPYAADDVVAEGIVGALEGDGGAPASFTSGGDDPFTVWIRTDGIGEENRRENVVAATACVAALSGDETASFQGNRQGQALTIGDDSTVGWFTAAEGQVEVACHQEPFGRQRTWLDDEHDFVVVRGKPAGPWTEVGLLTGSIGVLLVGIFTLLRWRRGRVVTS